MMIKMIILIIKKERILMMMTMKMYLQIHLNICTEPFENLSKAMEHTQTSLHSHKLKEAENDD